MSKYYSCYALLVSVSQLECELPGTRHCVSFCVLVFPQPLAEDHGHYVQDSLDAMNFKIFY